METGPAIVAATLLASAAVVLWSYRVHRTLFHPLVWWCTFFAVHMCGGYFVNYALSAFRRPDHEWLIGYLIGVAFLSFLAGYSMVARSVRQPDYVVVSSAMYSVVRERLYALFALAVVAGVAFYYFRGGVLLSADRAVNRFAAVSGWGYVYQSMMMLAFFVPAFLGAKWFFRRKAGLLGWAAIGVSVVFIAAPLNRGPIVWMLVAALLLRSVLVRPVRPWIVAGLFIAAVAGAALVGNVREVGVGNVAVRALNDARIHVWNLSHHLEYAERLPPVGVKPVWMSVAMLAPGPQQDFASYMRDQLGFVAIPSVTLIGEGYLEGRSIGVVANFVFIGMLLASAYGATKRRFSLRSCLLYMAILVPASSAVNYGIHKVLISTLQSVVLVLIVVPNGTALGWWKSAASRVPGAQVSR